MIKFFRLGIAISTAVTLAERLTAEQEFEITRNRLNGFSDTMLKFKQELVRELRLTNMENTLFNGEFFFL